MDFLTNGIIWLFGNIFLFIENIVYFFRAYFELLQFLVGLLPQPFRVFIFAFIVFYVYILVYKLIRGSS